MDRNHLGQCTALFNRTDCERYWEARPKMVKIDFILLLLLFLWLLLIIRTFILTLNVFRTYIVILTFYFYWSHRSMINSQCTCHLLTPWCRVLLEKLTVLQVVKKFPAFHGTRRFITVLTSVRHLSLSWASTIQFIYPHPTSWRSILILSTHLRLGIPTGLLPSGFPTKILYTSSPLPYVPHAQPISFFSIL